MVNIDVATAHIYDRQVTADWSYGIRMKIWVWGILSFMEDTMEWRGDPLGDPVVRVLWDVEEDLGDLRHVSPQT